MSNANSNNIYYRVLYSLPHIVKHRQRIFSSSYTSIPGEWIDKWKKTKSTTVNDYKLKCFAGVFTENARKNFIEISKIKLRNSEDWDTNEKILASEVVGVYAFNNPQDTLDFGYGPHSSKNIYIEFEGEYIKDAVEDNAVQAKVITIIGEWSEDEYIKEFNLTLPKD